MVKTVFDESAMRELSKELEDLRIRVDAIALEMKKSKVNSLYISRERARVRGISDLQFWLDEAEVELLRAKRSNS